VQTPSAERGGLVPAPFVPVAEETHLAAEYLEPGYGGPRGDVYQCRVQGQRASLDSGSGNDSAPPAWKSEVRWITPAVAVPTSSKTWTDTSSS